MGGGHESVGALIEYFTTPMGFATKIYSADKFPFLRDSANNGDRMGQTMADTQTWIQDLCIIGMTGDRQPPLMSDWTHIFLDHKIEETKSLHDAFLQELRELSNAIDERNRLRPVEFNMFNPRFLETSVSI